VLVEEQSAVAKVYYRSIIVAGGTASPLILASTEGGQEIEVVAHNNPDAIVRLPISPVAGYEPYVGRVVADRLGLGGEQGTQFGTLLAGLSKTFQATDASMVEVNPLVVTEEGKVLALDGKVNIDDNAMFRHKDLEALRDKDEEDPLEVLAQELGVANFIKLDGTSGAW
jgi:succinyl-CoA synthetase beta subunit